MILNRRLGDAFRTSKTEKADPVRTVPKGHDSSFRASFGEEILGPESTGCLAHISPCQLSVPTKSVNKHNTIINVNNKSLNQSYNRSDRYLLHFSILWIGKGFRKSHFVSTRHFNIHNEATRLIQSGALGGGEVYISRYEATGSAASLEGPSEKPIRQNLNSFGTCGCRVHLSCTPGGNK